MSSRHPSSFFPDLTDERLAKIAELLLDIRFNTLREMDSPYDDSYTREATVFGRSRNLLIEQCLSRRYSWLSLANPGMDVTFRIGSVPCRFSEMTQKTLTRRVSSSATPLMTCLLKTIALQ